MSVFTSANTAKIVSLNGLWDFCPCLPGDPMLVIPTDGWEEDVYVAPSSWTGPGSEAFGYPAAWARSRQGWLRRFIRIDRRSSRRIVMQFDAVGPRATVFLNGAAVGETLDAFTPFEADLTEVATPGVNELVIRVLDTPHDERGRARHPAGRGGYAGISQDVRLVERGEVYVGRVAITASTRKGVLSADVEICNATRRPRTVTVLNDVVAWKKTLKIATADAVLDLGPQTVEIPARSSVRYTVERPWPKPRLWSPEHPNLSVLRFRIEENGHAVFVQGQRFGFREIWTEGSGLFLNGEPLRLFSDHGPAPALHQGTEGWIRRWFELLRATGLNHARLGGACAAQLVRDLADEEGMLLTVESALDGAATPLATELPEFWVHSTEHLRRLVLQDRNHPSVILWSVSHNVLQDLSTPSPAFRELPRLRAMIRELDPTRPSYFDGDSVHWSPAVQDLMDGRPGRFESIYDAPDHPRLATAFTGIADAERYIALARANGAAGVAVQSPTAALSPFPEHEVRLKHADLDAPGLKLPVVAAGSAGLDFWSAPKKGAAYPPNDVLRTYAAAFRPLAVIDVTPATAVYEGQSAVRRVAVCNDSAADVTGTLEAAFRLRDAVFATQSSAVTVPRGGRVVQEVVFEIPLGTPIGVARLDYAFVDSKGRKLDQQRVPFRVARAVERNKRLDGKAIAVVGGGALQTWLEGAHVPFQALDSVESAALAKTRVVVLGPHTVVPGSDQLPILREFVRKGGSLVVLEQEHSLFQDMPLVPRTAWLATCRNAEHAAFAGLNDADLVCWNNLPVAVSGYLTGDRAATLADDDGDALLLEVHDGKGVVLATQLRIPAAVEVTPAASQLLLNLLTYAATFRCTAPAPHSAALEGEFTPVPAHTGKGYAETFWLRNVTTSAAMAEHLVAATVRANADFAPVQVFSVGDRWDTVHRTNGWATAVASSSAAPIYLYSRFYADVEVSDLQIEGEGSVEVSVGGVTYPATLQEGGAVLRGIVLQKGYNAVLVLWKPAGSESRLRAVWCHEGKPQTAFAFA